MIFISHGNGIESRLETERINAIILEDSEQYTGLIQKLWNQIHKVEETLLLYGAENELLDMSNQCDLLFSIRDLSLQNSRIQKKLITYLAEEIQMSELYDKMVENQAGLLQIMEEIKNIGSKKVLFFIVPIQYSCLQIKIHKELRNHDTKRKLSFFGTHKKRD